MANVAEGFSRQSKEEFIQYLIISKSSAAEFQSHLYAAFDQNYIKQDEFYKLYSQANKVSKIDSGFKKYLRAKLKKSKLHSLINSLNNLDNPNEPN